MKTRRRTRVKVEATDDDDEVTVVDPTDNGATQGISSGSGLSTGSTSGLSQGHIDLMNVIGQPPLISLSDPGSLQFLQSGQVGQLQGQPQGQPLSQGLGLVRLL